MDDRELLELAAKAAGLAPDAVSFWKWNPLTDDGDALRLACRLKLNIYHGDFSIGISDEGEIDAATYVPNEAERPAAARRLIVNAAAAMAPDSDVRDPHQGGAT